MTTNQLRETLNAKPFKPFRLQLADGDRVQVQHPELLLITPGGRTIVVATSEDAVKIIDLLLVTAIEIGNGKGSSRRRK